MEFILDKDPGEIQINFTEYISNYKKHDEFK